MNKRIKELAKQAGMWKVIHFPHLTDEEAQSIEQFAKLIVKECASIFEGVYTDQQRPERIDTRIKDHFGVE